MMLRGRLSGSPLLEGNLSQPSGMSGRLVVGSDIPLYKGETVFTPSSSVQVIPIAGMRFDSDFTINPIPSNYGRIAWDGSTLTVS